MVVLCILSILSVYGFISIKEYKSKYYLKAATRMLHADMEYARTCAVKYNRQYRVVFKKDKMLYEKGVYEVQRGSSNKNSKFIRDNQDKTFVVRDFNDFTGISISKATNNPIFNTNGTISCLASITLKNNKNDETRISTSIAGRISIK